MISTIESSTNPLNEASEINRLYAKVTLTCGLSEDQIQEALAAAWKAGELLSDKKRLVKRMLGHGSWEPWLKRNFTGSVRTAQRYMALTKNVTGVTDLKGISLRQAYMRLGLSVERKGIHDPVHIPALPVHIRATNRFLMALPSVREINGLSDESRNRWMRDLRPAWDRLRLLFEAS